MRKVVHEKAGRAAGGTGGGRRAALGLLSAAVAVSAVGCQSGAHRAGAVSRSTSSAATGSPQPSASPTLGPDQVRGLGRVVATYDVSGTMAVADGQVFVADDSHLYQLDPSSGRPLRTLAINARPYKITVDSTTLWLSNPSEDQSAGATSYTVVSRTTFKKLRSVPVPNSMAATFVRGALWVLDESRNQVDEVDAASGRVTRRVTVGDWPFDARYAFGSLWTANHHGGGVTRLDPGTGRVQASIATADGPGRLADGAGSLWVANWNDTVVSRVDPSSNKVVAKIAVPSSPVAIAYGAGAVWAMDADGGNLLRIDPRTNRIVSTIPVLPARQGADIAIVGSDVWVSVAGIGTYKIDPNG